MSIPGFPEWTAGEMSPAELDRVDRLAQASRRPYFNDAEEFYTGEAGTVARLASRLACWARLTATDGSGVYSWQQVFREDGTWDNVEGGLSGVHNAENPARPVSDNGAIFFADATTGDIVWMTLDEDGLNWSFECCRDMIVVNETSSFTITPADDLTFYEVDATSGAVSISLPPSSTVTDGFRFWVRRKDASANSIAISPNGADTIDSYTSTRINPQYTTFEVVWLGNEWSVISQSFPVTGRVKGTILALDGFNWEPLLPGSNGKALFADSSAGLGIKWADIVFPAPVIVVQSQSGSPSYTGIGLLQVNYFGSGSLTNGLSITNPSTGVAQINLDLASASGGGAVSTDHQTFVGAKTFDSTATYFTGALRVGAGEASVGYYSTIGKYLIGYPATNTTVFGYTFTEDGGGGNWVGMEQDATNNSICFLSRNDSGGPQIIIRGFGGTQAFGQTRTVAGLNFTRGWLTGGTYTGGANGTFSSGSF